MTKNKMMFKNNIKTVGYTDRFSVRAGEEINFMISSENEKYTAEIEKIISGMTNVDDNDLKVKPIDADCNGTYKGYKQKINIGSYAELPIANDWLKNNEFSFSTYIWPTLLNHTREQVILSAVFDNENVELKLSINKENRLLLEATDCNGKKEKVTSQEPILEREWCYVMIGYSSILKQLVMYKYYKGSWRQTYDMETRLKIVDLNYNNVNVEKVLLAAEYNIHRDHSRKKHFNGKIDSPRFYRRMISKEEVGNSIWKEAPQKKFDDSLVADYDFSKEISSDIVIDCSGNNLHGKVYQGPTRGVTGHNWTGKEKNFKHAPDEYGAIHFHEDDLENAEWDVSVSWKLPNDLKSGVYALKLDDGEEIDYVPFFVRPKKDDRKAPILFLAPTNTYLAYANERLFNNDFDQFMEHDLKIAPQDAYIMEHSEVGKSLYDLHNDGSGVTYSTGLRPIMNMRPHYRNWITGTVRHLAADLYITGWLENRGKKYDVATDEDLDVEGINLLNEYKVIITGSHPEYWTREMMESLEKYLANGGKIMYLGANGFYWVTSLHPDKKYIAEVRRGNAGTRCWDSPAGEIYHSTTGEYGSLWRYNGYIPQEFLGVGFTAQGWGKASGYKRLPDSERPEAQFVFEGINKDEIIGDFGYILGGAAGDEIDRYDLNLGTPKHALRLATTLGFGNQYQFVHEDLLMTSAGQGGEDNDLVRADMTYFDIEGGGEVFSVGSITWAGSLAWNDFDNNVAKVSDNVLNKFIGEKNYC